MGSEGEGSGGIGPEEQLASGAKAEEQKAPGGEERKANGKVPPQLKPWVKGQSGNPKGRKRIWGKDDIKFIK